MKDLAYRWLPVLLWMSLIFFLSSQTNLPGPENKSYDFLFKKAGHVAAYAILALLVLRAVWGFKRAALYAILFCVVYAISDEFHQSLVPTREATVRDVLIDSVAAGATVILARGRLQSYLDSRWSKNGHIGD